MKEKIIKTNGIELCTESFGNKKKSSNPFGSRCNRINAGIGTLNFANNYLKRILLFVTTTEMVENPH
ncbi:hypothetical protein NXV57_27675 [Bacteroides thetaiotaomicron]|nr:hypothetical protein [Bacteroides thetaiotaomicron]